MKSSVFRSCTIAIFLFVAPMFAWSESSYDIESFYTATDVPSGTLGISTSGSMTEISKVLTPTKINVGTYKVTVKRVDSNLYEILGKGIFIKTRYCYEYSYGEEVIVDVTSTYGFSVGKIIFD